MLGKEYREQFLSQVNNSKAISLVINNIIIHEEKFSNSCTEWSNDQFEEYLKSFHSTSPNAISRPMRYLRDFSNFICDKENLSHTNYSLPVRKIYEMVDYDKILSITITPEQYQHIKNQLTLNIRDRVMFELAWQTLTANEIKYLRETDFDATKGIIQLPKREWEIKAEDMDIFDDIQKCIEEKCYYIGSKDGHIKGMSFKKGDYLLKPIFVGVQKEDNFIGSPSVTMQRAFIQQKIKCPGIDIPYLSIEDIRRSKIIYLASSKENDDLVKLLGSGNIMSHLAWLRRLAKIVYNIPDKPKVKYYKSKKDLIMELALTNSISFEEAKEIFYAKKKECKKE